MDPLILCPSYGRPGNVIVRKWLPSAVLMVPESQYDEYQEKEGGELLRYPDDREGNLSWKRSAMLDYAWEHTDFLCMVDDDVRSFGMFEHGGEVLYDEPRFLEWARKGNEVAKELGAYLWGPNIQKDPMFYMEFTPLNFNVPVLDPLHFHRRDPKNLRYDDRLSVKLDYDMTLQHLLHYRITLRFDKWHYDCGHLTDNPGGLTSFRRMAQEVEQLELLQRKWGRKVVTFNAAKSVNPIIHCPF